MCTNRVPCPPQVLRTAVEIAEAHPTVLARVRELRYLAEQMRGEADTLDRIADQLQTGETGVVMNAVA